MGVFIFHLFFLLPLQFLITYNVLIIDTNPISNRQKRKPTHSGVPTFEG